MTVAIQGRLAWFVTIVGVVLLAASPAVVGADKPEFTPEQRAEVRAARQAFNSAGKNIKKQQKAIDLAVNAGPHAATPLVRVIESRFKVLVKKYKSSVGRAVKKLGAKRLITSVDEFHDSNKKLVKARNVLEKMSAMHASLQSAIEAGPIKKVASSEESEVPEQNGAATDVTGQGATGNDGAADGVAIDEAENGAVAKANDSTPEQPADSDKAAAENATENAADNVDEDGEKKPTLFDEVPMIELVALGIGAPGMSQREIDCVLWTNRWRSKLGLRLLWADPKLSDTARMHSKDMVEHNFRAHVSPLPGKENFRDRGKMFDTRADGENIAEAPFSGEKIVEYWLDSPPHKANIEHPKFRRIGVGLHNDVWTQVFGGIDSFEQ